MSVPGAPYRGTERFAHVELFEPRVHFVGQGNGILPFVGSVIKPKVTTESVRMSESVRVERELAFSCK